MEKRNKIENSRNKHHDRLLYKNNQPHSKYFILEKKLASNQFIAIFF